MGSLNLLTLQFPGTLMPYDFLSELKEIWDSWPVRPNAFIFLRKDKNGAIAGMEAWRAIEEDDVAATNAVLAAIAAALATGSSLPQRLFHVCLCRASHVGA